MSAIVKSVLYNFTSTCITKIWVQINDRSSYPPTGSDFIIVLPSTTVNTHFGLWHVGFFDRVLKTLIAVMIDEINIRKNNNVFLVASDQALTKTIIENANVSQSNEHLKRTTSERRVDLACEGVQIKAISS